MPIAINEDKTNSPATPISTKRNRIKDILLILAILLIPLSYILTSHLPSSPIISSLRSLLHLPARIPALPAHCTKAFPFSPSSRFSTSRAAPPIPTSTPSPPPLIPATPPETPEMVFGKQPNAATGPAPKLSAKEEKEWNHLAEGMSYYHDHFRHSFDTVYELAAGDFARKGLSLPSFLREATSLSSHLEMHHTIEERHIFPILSRRMPEFANSGPSHKMSSQVPDSALGSHLIQHKRIHAGLDEYDGLLKKYKEDNTVYDPKELRACMDGFRQVLFEHLDEEVKTLGGENMRKAGWSLEEVRRIPM